MPAVFHAAQPRDAPARISRRYSGNAASLHARENFQSLEAGAGRFSWPWKISQ
jgi:hypothetical protein